MIDEKEREIKGIKQKVEERNKGSKGKKVYIL